MIFFQRPGWISTRVLKIASMDEAPGVAATRATPSRLAVFSPSSARSNPPTPVIAASSATQTRRIRTTAETPVPPPYFGAAGTFESFGCALDEAAESGMVASGLSSRLAGTPAPLISPSPLPMGKRGSRSVCDTSDQATSTLCNSSDRGRRGPAQAQHNPPR